MGGSNFYAAVHRERHRLRDGTLSIALNTKYAFAEVPAQMDMRDLGAVRKWYTATLQGMCRILDVLLKSGLPAAE